jgi:hypothetical protein
LGAQGTATVSFGSAAAAQAGASSGPYKKATVTVTGQSGIVSGSEVEAWLRAEPAGTTQHTHGELIALVEDLQVVACNIVASTGFDIVVTVLRGGIYGDVPIDWVWN